MFRSEPGTVLQLEAIMKRQRLRPFPTWLFPLFALALPLSCNSVPLNKDHLQECSCGTPEADTLGCAAECALAGPGACQNPLCTCEADPHYIKADRGDG